MDFEVYCDESGQQHLTTKSIRSDTYVLIGGLWIEASNRETHKSKIRRIRNTHQVHGEFKWNRVSPSRQDFYRDLVRLFFRQPMNFRCLVLPADQLDAVRFHDADEELMFYKFYYQLLHHWILDFDRYRIFVDLKTDRVKSRIQTLENVLQNANPAAEILSVQALPSRELDLLQLTDVLIGAVSSRFHGTTTSTAKLAVVEAIEDRLRHPIRPTTRRASKFNVFFFRTRSG